MTICCLSSHFLNLCGRYCRVIYILWQVAGTPSSNMEEPQTEVPCSECFSPHHKKIQDLQQTRTCHFHKKTRWLREALHGSLQGIQQFVEDCDFDCSEPGQSIQFHAKSVELFVMYLKPGHIKALGTHATIFQGSGQFPLSCANLNLSSRKCSRGKSTKVFWLFIHTASKNIFVNSHVTHLYS